MPDKLGLAKYRHLPQISAAGQWQEKGGAAADGPANPQWANSGCELVFQRA